ncbi:uncharacterized protein LOC127480211 [Manacus candei]|uniref:uncharacterized protein LOC127480211 n=1 Tax=Manacus candei TaxID=415023 RepID=UPI002226B3D1|nr:uncharacterized protein LOC127480211 [Manacus candei]
MLCCGTPDVERVGCSAVLSLRRSLLKGKDILTVQMCWIRDPTDDSLQPDLGGIKTEDLPCPLCLAWLFPGVAAGVWCGAGGKGHCWHPWAKGTAGEARRQSGLNRHTSSLCLLVSLLHKEPPCSCSKWHGNTYPTRRITDGALLAGCPAVPSPARPCRESHSGTGRATCPSTHARVGTGQSRGWLLDLLPGPDEETEELQSPSLAVGSLVTANSFSSRIHSSGMVPTGASTSYSCCCELCIQAGAAVHCAAKSRQRLNL